MDKKAKLTDPLDNVVTSVSDIEAGEKFIVINASTKSTFTANHDIPFGHKIAVKDIKLGQEITKYGKPIGIASKEIKLGDWVHTHNVKDNYEVK